MSERIDPVLVHADGSAVFHRELDRGYPLIERGAGMWLVDTHGNRYLDAVGGGTWTKPGRYGRLAPCRPGRPVSASVAIVGPW